MKQEWTVRHYLYVATITTVHLCYTGLVSLFNGISNFVGYLMAKPSS